jgi:hypothetical protein
MVYAAACNKNTLHYFGHCKSLTILAVKHYINKALTLPPHVTVRRVACRIKRAASETLMRRQGEKTSSFANDFPTGQLLSYFPGLSVERLLPYAETIAGVTINFLDHRFDLLGSGWMQVKHGMHCRGLEEYRYDMGEKITADHEGKWMEGRINTSNLAESKRMWGFVDSDYIPIDWHIDFKSGYRWHESTWYKDIKYGHKLGVDIKVPWELARMQHLPQLAMAYALAETLEGTADSGAKTNISAKIHFELPEVYAREFRDEVLDFIATNPPRFGVNWACPMDVAIRAANWLLAYDIFQSAGVCFDKDFKTIFVRSVYEHGRHIVTNLEWNHQVRGNHYLADIAGLAFIAAYLPSTDETDSWLAFSVQELVVEVGHQFYPDGGNFEGSTAYHRLAAEMVYYATTLILGLPPDRREILKRNGHLSVKTGLGKPKLRKEALQFYRLPCGSVCEFEDSPFPLWYFERMERRKRKRVRS